MTIATVQTSDFQSLCREWRRHRKFSQLELAVAADVSQRHVSWLETGKSKPSREMVVRLSEAMDVPLRERNVLLQAAGFAGAFAERSMDDPAMAAVLSVLETMLSHHDPLPAFVIDRCWNVKMQNRSAENLLEFGGADALKRLATLEDSDGGEMNLALLTLHPLGLRQFVTNWQQAAPPFIQRLRREAMASVDPATQATLNQLIEIAGPIESAGPGQVQVPALPLELALGDVRLSLFTVVSTFGSPQDITIDELRVESMYAADASTKEFFAQLTPPLPA